MIDGFNFTVDVIRTNRVRSVSIYLEGEIVKMRVPKSLSEKRIREFITKRTPWIKTKLKEVSERPLVKSKEYVSGEMLSYLGRTYRLKVTHGNETSIKLKGRFFSATVLKADKTAQETIRSMLISWYRQHAETGLSKKTEYLAGIIGVQPNSITVKDYKSRWGSCSNRGDITYNWKVILAPQPIIDYVVVHELCHMLEHNHSSRYWKHVERYASDWRDCRNWLKTNSHSMCI